MNTQFQIQVEHLYVVDGMLERLPHNQTAIPVPQARHSRQGALFVLAEVQGRLNNTDLIEKRLTILARDTYYNHPHASITAGLRHAMDTANQWLFQHNATHPPEKQVIAGLVAVVLHNDDLFVAQAGPAAVYTNLDGFITRYPENSTWLQPVRNPLVGPSPALGLAHTIDPYITHLQVQAGDVIVLVDGRLGKNLSPEKAEVILDGDDIKQISQKLVKNIQLQHGSAMVLQTLAPEAATPAAKPKPARQPVAHAPREKGGFNFAVPTAISGAVHHGRQHGSAATAMPRPRAPFTLPKLPSMPQLPQFDIPVAEIWHAIVDGVLGGITFLGNGLQTILRLVLPSSATADSTAPRSSRRPSRSALKTVAFVLPLLAIAVALITYVYQGYHRTQQYTETLTEANQKFATALTSPADQQRVLLHEAELLANQAAAIKAEQPEVAALKEKIVTQQDTINNVKYLYYVPTLKEYDPAAQPKNVIRAGMELYVLDAAGGKIYHHTLDAISDTLLPTDSVAAQTGQAVDSVAVGNLLGMVWIPAAGERPTAGLVIATDNGLFQFDPARNVLSAISIFSPDQWQNPVAFDTYYGNLYVLDAAANQIFRYWAAADGYPNPPDKYFAEGIPVNLSGAVDMTIDGAIYVLYNNGHIAKFLSGEPQPFEITGLDVPLKNPVAIVSPAEDAPYLYVADAGNQRIVQLSKEGQFIAQFKPKTAKGDIVFDDLRDMFIHPADGKMYILNGNALLAPALTE